jgi:hypothetical protein
VCFFWWQFHVFWLQESGLKLPALGIWSGSCVRPRLL